MASKKCLICSSSFSGRRDAKTCSARCRKRLQKVKWSFVAVPAKRQLAKTLLILIVGIFSFAAVLLSIKPVATAAPSSNLNFQARLLSSAGAVVADGDYNIEFKIYDTLSSGASAQGVCSLDSSTDDCWWLETRTGANKVRVVNGYMSVNLGSVTAFGSSIKWNEEHWLTMNIGGTGSPSWDGEMSPRIKLTALPYAFQAGELAKTSGANRGTLSFNTVANNPVIQLPDATGTVCLQNATACGFAPTTGGAGYIQNGTSVQSAANFAIQSGAAGSIGGLIRGHASQSANLLELQTGTPTTVFSVSASGTLLSKNSTDSTTAFQVQNAAGSQVLNIDTTKSLITQAPIGASYLGGADSSGTTNGGVGSAAAEDVFTSGRYTYVVKGGSAPACSATAGSAAGCELQIYDTTVPGSPTYVGGADASGSTNSGTGSKDFVSVNVAGRYAYIASTGNATACSQTAGSAIGCELMVFDVSTPSSPTYVGGVDVSGAANSGTGNLRFNKAHVSGRYLYMGTAGNATACSGTVGSAIGCETQVYDISNPAIPVYKNGIDVSASTGSGTGLTQIKNIFVQGRYLYASTAGNTTTCSATAGSAEGCELQVYDISNPASPIYKGGGDSSGTTNGGAGSGNQWGLYVSGRYAYLSKDADSSSCGGGNKWGCELQIWDIVNPLSPTYVSGADVSGSANSGTGSSNIGAVFVNGRYAYIFKDGDATACSQTAGSAIGCELQIYDVSSPSTPTYKGGADISGTTNSGTANNNFYNGFVSGRYIYSVKQSDSTACSQTAGSAIGCELQVYDSSGIDTVALTAGAVDTGNLQVQTNANIANNLNVSGGLIVGQNVQISGNVGVSGSALFQNVANSTTAFQVQNSSGAQLLNIDTTNPVADFTTNGNNNLITNGSFESSNSTTGWAADGAGVTIAQDNTLRYIGNSSLSITTGASATRGAKFNLTTTTLASNTKYNLTLSARMSTGSATMSTFEIGRAEDGSTHTSCLTGQTIDSSGWKTFNCSFTTGTTSSTPFIYVNQTDATARTFYIDGVQLTRASLLPNHSVEQAISGNWTALGTPTTHARVTTQFQDQTASLQITTQATANQGTKQNLTLADNTKYTLSFYGLASGTTITTMAAGYSYDGTTGNEQNCMSGQTIPGSGGSVTGGWTLFECVFTTPANHSGTPYIYIKNTAAAVRTFYIDNVQLTLGNPLGAYQEGQISLNGTIISPTTFQGQFDSTTAFQIQNTNGGNLFQVDSLYSNITLNGANSYSLMPWKSSTSLPVARERHGTVYANGYVYVIGGYNNADATQNKTTVLYAKLNADGSIGSWNCQGAGTTGAANSCGTSGVTVTNSNTLPAARRGLTSVYSNGYLYAFGGYDGSNPQTSIYYAKVNSDGSTGAWKTESTNPLADERSGHSTTIINGYVYIIQGFHNADRSRTVFFAKLNTDGSVGQWKCQGDSSSCETAPVVNGNALPTPNMEGRGIAVANGYIYLIAGSNGSQQAQVHYAKVNTDGTTNAWTTSANLPEVFEGANVYALNGYLYVAGGDGFDTVFYAKINSDNSLGAWHSDRLNYFPTNRVGYTSSSGGITVNGYLYIIGGTGFGNSSANTYYSSTARTQIAGSLDLLGITGQDQLDVGSQAGSLTAGNTNILGSLGVRGQADFAGNVNIEQNLSVANGLSVIGPTSLKGVQGTTGFLQVQNAGGVNALNINTVNRLAGGSFEGASNGTTPEGWSAKGSGVPTVDNTQSNFGTLSMKVVTTTAANDGAKFNFSFAESTQYTLSLYARVASGSITDFVVGRQETGSDSNCLTGQTVNTTWTRFTCTFTTGTSITTSPNIYVQKSGTSAETFFIDGVQLETAAAATTYRESDIRLDGMVLARSSSDSTTAFQIQNAAGTHNLFVADTTNNRIGVGINAPTAKLDVRTATGNTDDILQLYNGSTLRTNVTQFGVQNWNIADSGGTTQGGISLSLTGSALPTIFLDTTATSQSSRIRNADPAQVGSDTTKGLALCASTNTTCTNQDLTLRASDGGAVFKNSADSTTAFQVQRASSGGTLFTIDTSTTSGSRNGIITIGASDTNATILVLDTKTGSGDPTGVDGAMYYNSNSNSFRCYQNGAWVSCIGGLLSSNTAASSAITNTAAETDFSLNYSMPANYCVAGRTIRWTAQGVYSTTGTPTLTFKVKAGSTALATSPAITGGNGVTDREWRIEGQTICNAAPGATAATETHGMVSLFTAAGTSSFGELVNTSTTNLATNGALTLQISLTWSAADVANTATMRQFIIEGMGP